MTHDVLQTRVMPSAECHTEHRLVRCKLKLRFKPKPKKRGPYKKKLYLAMLHHPKVEADVQAGLLAKLEYSSNLPDPSPETMWEQLKSSILQTSEEIIGFTTRKNIDWFDENDAVILELLAKRWSAHQAHLSQPSCLVKKAAFRHACSNLQHTLREIQNNWWITSLKEPNCVQTQVTTEGFMKVWKKCMAPQFRFRVPCAV